MATFSHILKSWGSAGSAEHPILLRIQHEGKRRYLSSGISIAKKHWNERRSEVRKDHPQHDLLNRRLALQLSEANTAYNALELTGEDVSADLIQGALRPRGIEDFWEFAEKWLDMIAARPGAFHYPKQAQSVLRKFERLVGRPLKWDRLSPHLLTRFDEYMRSALSNGPSTRNSAFRVLQNLVNNAVLAGKLSAAENPFARFTIPKAAHPQKSILTMEEIARITDLELQAGSKIALARDCFLVSFWCRGMRISDVLALRWENIEEGHVSYVMSKNGKLVRVPLHDEVKTVLSRYERGQGRSFIFASHDKGLEGSLLKKRLMSQVALVNRYLKKLAGQAGIEKHLTSHMSRHSFASQALQAGISYAAIKEGLKHGSISTTERYLRSLPSDLIDEEFRSAGF